MLGSLNVLIYERGRVSFTRFLWWIWLQQPWESCCFICALREQQGSVSVASVALLLGFVQWGAAMQMGSIELTQDIISCQRFVAIL